MKIFLFYLAAGGWLAGLTSHLLSIAGSDIISQFPFIWVLHLSIFVVWLPAMLELKRNEALQELQQSGIINKLNPIKLFKTVFRHTPIWLATLAVAGFYYALATLIYFATSQHGVPDVKGSEFILHNHGHLIRTLTEQEYHHYRANEARAFSVTWMAFYGMGAAILFPFNKNCLPSDD